MSFNKCISINLLITYSGRWQTTTYKVGIHILQDFDGETVNAIFRSVAYTTAEIGIHLEQNLT